MYTELKRTHCKLLFKTTLQYLLKVTLKSRYEKVFDKLLIVSCAFASTCGILVEVYNLDHLAVSIADRMCFTVHIYLPILQCKELLELKSSALELLNVLLEETSDESFQLLQGISQDIAKDIILDTMLALWVSCL